MALRKIQKSVVTNSVLRLLRYLVCCSLFYSLSSAQINESGAIDIALRKTAYDVLHGDVEEVDRIFLKSLHKHFDSLIIHNAKDKTISEVLSRCALHFENGMPITDNETEEYLTSLKKLWRNEYNIVIDDDFQKSSSEKLAVKTIKIPFCLVQPERDLVLHKVKKGETYSDYYESFYRSAHDGTFYRINANKNGQNSDSIEAEVLQVLRNTNLDFPVSPDLHLKLTRVLESYSTYYNTIGINNSIEDLEVFLGCLRTKVSPSECKFDGTVLDLGPWKGNVNFLLARTPRFVYAKPLDSRITSTIKSRDDLLIYKSGKELITSGVSGCNFDKSSKIRVTELIEAMNVNSYVFKHILERMAFPPGSVDIYVIDIGFSNIIDKSWTNLEYVKATEEYLSLSTPGHGTAVSVIAAGGVDFLNVSDADLKKNRVVQKSLSSYPERYVQLSALIKDAHSANQFSVVNMSFEEVDSSWSNEENLAGYFTTSESEHALYVFAAGNHGETYNAASATHLSNRFPPSQVILVGALSDNNSSRGINSSKGDLVKIYAPGCVKSVWDGEIKAHWGTSFAAPKFSFTASIVGSELIKNKKRFTPLDVMDQILSTADIDLDIKDRQFKNSTETIGKGFALILNEVSATNVFLDSVVLKDGINHNESGSMSYYGNVIGIYEYDDSTPLVDLDSGLINVTGRANILLDGMEKQLSREVQDMNKTVPFYEASVSCKLVDNYIFEKRPVKGIRQILMLDSNEIAYLGSKKDYSQITTVGLGDELSEVHLLPACLDWVSSENSFVAIYEKEQLVSEQKRLERSGTPEAKLTLIPTSMVSKINFASYKFSAYKNSLN